jgi:hypothetical protein
MKKQPTAQGSPGGLKMDATPSDPSSSNHHHHHNNNSHSYGTAERESEGSSAAAAEAMSDTRCRFFKKTLYNIKSKSYIPIFF